MVKGVGRVIVVLGMHRSGTSVLARGLQVLGVELGRNLMPAFPANPKGHWEDRDINNLNERILAALARNWRSPGLIDDSVWNSSALEPLVSEAKQLLDSRFGRLELWGFKDPRTCMLLPFWQPVFRELGLEARYVISLRNPLSVAASLRARDAMAEELSFLLWLEHLVAAFKYTKDQRRLVVEYDELLKAPRIQICRIAKALGLPAPISTDAALQSYEGEFLAVDLRHHEFSADHSPSDSPLKRLAVSTYELLRQVSIDEIDCDRASLGKKLGRAYRTLEAITPFSSMVAELDRTNEQLNSANQQLKSDYEQLSSDNRQLNSDNQQLSSANQQLNLHNQQLSSANQQLNSDNQQLSSANQQLNLDNQQLNSVNQQLNSDNEQLNSVNQQLNSANQQLDSANQQLKSDNQQLKSDNQQLKSDNEQLNSDNQQLKSANQQLNSANQQLNADNQQLNADNQQLNLDNQQLNSANQQLDSDNQRLNSENQQLNSDNQRLNSANQQLNSANQQLNLDNQELNSENQQLNSDNQRLNSANQQLNSDTQGLEGQRRDLETELKEITDSYAWRIVSRYREGLERARVRHPRATRFYESIAIRTLSRILRKRQG